ncbi:MAG: prolyl oligopeptidase family serine peptidase [Puia sp.]|nr:prolyl oligopeptidase family serine peptidase [Puia sp.]
MKPVIDSVAIHHWPWLSRYPGISGDGRFMMYIVENVPVGSGTMVVRATGGEWKKEFPGVSGGVFSTDSRQFIFLRSDTLYFLSLGVEGMSGIAGVVFYSQSVSGRWLVYQLAGTGHELVLRDMGSGQEHRFGNVAGYLLDEAEDGLLVKRETKTNDQVVTTLERIPLPAGSLSVIWSDRDHPGVKLQAYAMDRLGTQVAFMTGRQAGERTAHTISHYRLGMDKPEERASDGPGGIGGGLSVDGGRLQFSADGGHIFIGLVSHEVAPKPAPDAISVDVWSYQDSLLQSAQLYQIKNGSPAVYTAVIATGGGPVIRLEYGSESIQARQPAGDYVVVNRNNNPGDRFWLERPDSNWLVSLRDGSRIPLGTVGYSEFVFSPDGRYLVYYDAGREGNYFSYDLRTGKECKLSSGIPARWLAWTDDFSYTRGKGPAAGPTDAVGVVGWLPGDTALLVSGNYDIWKLSLEGHKPVNITRGYGRLHHTKLRVVDDQSISINGNTTIYLPGDTLLLVAFDTKTKYNGFYRVDLSGWKDPTFLSMGPWTLWHKSGMICIAPNEFSEGLKPLKALATNTWLVLRSTATDAPNYYLTHDFRTYRALTDLQPQRDYNWLTTELVSWTQPDGITAQGVLYKPTNFDPHKRYPVLFNYYQQLSHRVYEFPQPEYTESAHINIPWFVSRGYLVFTPDIYYRNGEMGPSVCATIVSAARRLSELPYVDVHRMALTGHSWGGAETNYLVTHTHQFAAVLSGAAGHNGVDLISNSLFLDGTGSNSLERYERDDIGSTLWQRPDLWIKNSPIFQADQVTSPLLIFYCKFDTDWERAVEFFIALRRLGKKVWLLQYDHGGHGVFGRDAEDFTIRVTQFFDHYLKDRPAPAWMTRGIPAKLKGIETGYEFDTNR